MFCRTLFSVEAALQYGPANKRQVEATVREVDGIAIVDARGRIALGEGNVAMLREVTSGLLIKGKKKIVLNLSQVEYMDSAGVGELVRCLTEARKEGGQLELAGPSDRVRDVLEVTKLNTLFKIHKDETAALKSMGGQVAPEAAA